MYTWSALRHIWAGCPPQAEAAPHQALFSASLVTRKCVEHEDIQGFSDMQKGKPTNVMLSVSDWGSSSLSKATAKNLLQLHCCCQCPDRESPGLQLASLARHIQHFCGHLQTNHASLCNRLQHQAAQSLLRSDLAGTNSCPATLRAQVLYESTAYLGESWRVSRYQKG